MTINGWIIFGLIGQLLFFLRFFIQWIISERKKQSVIPVGFWYFSLSGGIILLIYAIYKKDIVFTIGQATGILVYIRNLMLLRQPRPVNGAI